MGSMVYNRDDRLDSLKGFLILLVIFGHIIGESGITHCGSGGYVWGGGKSVDLFVSHAVICAVIGFFFEEKK